MVETPYKAEYLQLQKKYTQLPAYDVFNHYVEISFLTYDVYDNAMMARFFRRLAERRLESLIGFLQNILYPNNQSLISMEESGFFNDVEKKELSDIMKQCMILYRTCSLLNYAYNEQEECEKVAEIMTFLTSIQPVIDEKLHTIKKAWSQQKKDPDTFYTG